MATLNLASLSTWDAESGSLNVIIETPKGSRNKFAYDPKLKLFELGKVLPKGLSFPFDFGFIPSTAGEDGDPLDVLVLMDEPAFPGCKVGCRLIGVIEAEQATKGAKPLRNDRLVAVAEECRLDDNTHSIKQFGAGLIQEIEHFFSSYHGLDGKVFKALAYRGPKKARKIVSAGCKRLRK